MYIAIALPPLAFRATTALAKRKQKKKTKKKTRIFATVHQRGRTGTHATEGVRLSFVSLRIHLTIKQKLKKRSKPKQKPKQKVNQQLKPKLNPDSIYA